MKQILYFLVLLFSYTASSQCLSVDPLSNDVCGFGPGTFTLEATGSSGYYHWYDAAIGGNQIGEGVSFTTPIVNTTTSFYVAGYEPSYGLDFDGVNDRISLGSPPELQITGDMTIEMWLKPDNFSSRKNPYSKAYGGEGTITQEVNGRLNYYYGTNGGNSAPYQGFNSSASLVSGQWNHIALVRDLTNMKLYWYINGVLSAQANAVYPSATAGNNTAQIGDGYTNNYDGQIDEVRIWSSARSQNDIQSNMYNCMDPLSPNLNAYYKLDDNAGLIATDTSPNTNNGVMLGFDPATDWVVVENGLSCNCESNRVEVVVEITNGNALDLGPSMCVTESTVLDAGPGFAGYLWNTGETSQSITVNTSGTYSVTVDNGSGCSVEESVFVEVFESPITTDLCSMTGGSFDLEASGSSGSYNWYDAMNGGNLLGTGSMYTTPVINATTSYYVSAIKGNYGLDLDGTDDRITLGNPPELQITGDMTIEMWVKPDNFSSRKNPYSKAYGGEGTITQETSGILNYFYGTNGGNGGPYQGFSSGTPLVSGQWNHIAIVRDLTNMKLYWYINGVLTSQTNAVFSSATVSNLGAQIGDGYVNNYDGQIDEVRIWSSARSQNDIQSNLNNCMDPLTPNLNAYYAMNDGPGSAIATDSSPNANNGNLQGMDVSTDWIMPTNAISCDCESDRKEVIVEITGGVPVDIGADGTFDCGATSVNLSSNAVYSSYLWSTGATSSNITVTNPGIYWLQISNGSGCMDRDTIVLANGGGSGFALNLNGSNNYVELGSPPELQITGDLTIEMWIKPDNFSSRKNPYSKAYGGEGTITQETNGTLNFYYGTNGGNGGPYQGFNSSKQLKVGEWAHIALVRDLTNMKLYWYINGVLTSQTNASFASATAGNRLALIGKGYTTNFDGQIDEFRIWNTPRSRTEIRDKMCSKLDVNSSGLVAYYNCDASAGTTLYDQTNNGLNGIFRFGTSRVVSGARIGNHSAHLYTNNWSGKILDHAFCGGEFLRVSNMSGSPDGVHIYSVGNVPNSTAGIVGLGANNRYFGVFKVDDAIASYDATYFYNDNPFVGPENELELELFTRDDNSISTWVTSASTQDIPSKTIALNTDRTEFILGTNRFVLPITLLSFEATLNDEREVVLDWLTASETNNDFFTIERTYDGDNWFEVTTIEGAGNSSEILDYQAMDRSPLVGMSYYRLKQTDYDGRFSYSDIRMIDNRRLSLGGSDIMVWPNPNNGSEVNVEFKGYNRNSSIIVEVVDIFGQIVYQTELRTDENGFVKKVLSIEGRLEKGTYIIVGADNSISQSARLIIL